jgi:D-alanyl-D-alanine carboxypeptidase
MSQPAAARPPRRAITPTAVNLVIVATTIIGALVYQSASSSPSPSAPSFNDVHRGGLARADGDAVAADDGALPGGVTVFDDQYAGVANLDPDLRRALRDATTDAEDDGIELDVNSGWRSAAYQDRLLREARSEYGSAEEAARWVATSDTSPHVSGGAVDIRSADATAWLANHGAAYGLCQIYRNEPWHYELRPEAIERGCPHMYADPTQDPRMR